MMFIRCHIAKGYVSRNLGPYVRLQVIHEHLCNTGQGRAIEPQHRNPELQSWLQWPDANLVAIAGIGGDLIDYGGTNSLCYQCFSDVLGLGKRDGV